MKEFHKIIFEICNKHNIKCSLLSDNWILMLEKDEKVRFFVGFKSDLNRSAVSNLFDDKYGLFTVLKEKNIPVCDHMILFKNYDRKKVEDYFYDNNKYLVVKDNMGSCGTGVFKANELEKVYSLIDKILETNHSVCVSPFYDIKTEYRIININGESKLIYGKKRPVVIGDGNKSIIELLRDFNSNYFSKVNDDSLKIVLEKDKIYEYNWQFNLSRGSIPFYIYDEELLNKLKLICKKVVSATNIYFSSVDVVELNSGELLVLECNSGVMMENYIKFMSDGRDVAFSIYEEAVLKMFK